MRSTHSENYGGNALCIPEIWAEFDICPSNLTRCTFIKKIKSIHFI